jgi:hypothetical protein
MIVRSLLPLSHVSTEATEEVEDKYKRRPLWNCSTLLSIRVAANFSLSARKFADMSAVEQIEAAQARNLAVGRLRLASMPEVGIFWLVDNKLVADSIPWRQADLHGGFYSGKNDHAVFWRTLQRLRHQWQGHGLPARPGALRFDGGSLSSLFLSGYRQ